MSKQLTAKDVERIQMIAQDIASLDTPMKNEIGEDTVLGALIADTSPSPMELVIEEEKRDFLLKAMNECLEPREIKIMTMRYGLDGNENMTLREVGDTYGITRERIRQLEANSLKKLRLYFEKRGITGDMI